LDKMVAFSEDAGSDSIRVLVGRRADFEYKDGDVNPYTHGYHHGSGPDNRCLWKAAKFFRPDDYKKAAAYVAKELSRKALPYKTADQYPQPVQDFWKLLHTGYEAKTKPTKEKRIAAARAAWKALFPEHQALAKTIESGDWFLKTGSELMEGGA